MAAGDQDGLGMVDDLSDDPCQPNLLGFCRYCGRDLDTPSQSVQSAV